MNPIAAYDLAIQLETKVSQLYSRFSNLFRDKPEISRFWAQVAYNEKFHADTLTLSKGNLLWRQPATSPTQPSGWDIEPAVLETMCERVRGFEKRVRKERLTLQEAVGMMLEIEQGEIHDIYTRLVRYSGLKRPAKTQDQVHSPEGHIKTIKEFLSQAPVTGDQAQQGVLLSKRAAAQIPPPPLEKRETAAPKRHTGPGLQEGRIREIDLEMAYGLIEGDDGKSYLFLLDELNGTPLEGLQTDQRVTFRGRILPWGPRAYDMIFKG